MKGCDGGGEEEEVGKGAGKGAEAAVLPFDCCIRFFSSSPFLSSSEEDGMLMAEMFSGDDFSSVEV